MSGISAFYSVCCASHGSCPLCQVLRDYIYTRISMTEKKSIYALKYLFRGCSLLTCWFMICSVRLNLHIKGNHFYCWIAMFGLVLQIYHFRTIFVRHLVRHHASVFVSNTNISVKSCPLNYLAFLWLLFTSLLHCMIEQTSSLLLPKNFVTDLVDLGHLFLSSYLVMSTFLLLKMWTLSTKRALDLNLWGAGIANIFWIC